MNLRDPAYAYSQRCRCRHTIGSRHLLEVYLYVDNITYCQDYTKTTRCSLTNRMEELTKPKSLHNEYSGDRPSPIWDVSTASRTHTPTLRTFDLARAKTMHMEYRPCRSVETAICPAAKRAVASARIERLSNPKKDKRSGGEERCEEWGQPAWNISRSAKNATATEHLENLAVAKVSSIGM